MISALRKYPNRENFLADAIVAYGPEAIPLLDEAGLDGAGRGVDRRADRRACAPPRKPGPGPEPAAGRARSQTDALPIRGP